MRKQPGGFTFHDRFDRIVEKGFSGIAEQEYTMLYGKFQIVVSVPRTPHRESTNGIDFMDTEGQNKMM